MVPPPADSYPTMLQICLSLAELEPQIPITGIIRAAKGWKHLPLQLTIEQIDSIQIAWAEVYALDREEAEIDYPDEAKYWADLETDGASGEGPDKGVIR
jgi:hypothetical protein